MQAQASRVAWITGGGTGIGRGLALRLAADGWTVAISGRRPEPLAETAALQPEHLHSYPLDVSDPQAVRSTAARIEAELGPVVLVILSAGTGYFAKFSALSDDDFERHMQINYLGTVYGIHAVLPGMLERKAGHIVIVSSVAGYRGVPLATAYGPTKAALINLAEGLHFELAHKGIAISVCNPGYVKTPMTEKNPFPMPFLMQLDDAVDILYRGIQQRKFEITCPWQFVLILKFLRCMPYRLYFYLMRKFYGR